MSIRRSAPLVRRTPPRRAARPRRQRKSGLATLRRELWALVAAYVKDTHGNACFTCGALGLAGSNWHAGHFVNAGKSAAVRYHPDNLRPQCGRCNVWLRGNLAEYAIRLMDELGEAKFRALIAASRKIKQWTMPELRALIAAARVGAVEFELAYYGMETQ